MPVGRSVMALADVRWWLSWGGCRTGRNSAWTNTGGLRSRQHPRVWPSSLAAGVPAVENLRPRWVTAMYVAVVAQRVRFLISTRRGKRA